VDISDNNLTDPRLAAFLTELAENEAPLKLCISGENSTGYDSCRVLGRILNARPTIVELHLPRNLSDEAVCVLCDGLPENTSQ
jgi:hypothetical protein